MSYTLMVLAIVATGVLSFGLWVHHMYTTGLSPTGLGFFAAASMAVSIPSAVQVFGWMTTLWAGRPVWRTPLLFVAGFLVIFTLGGLTGVMVAAVPFDWQVHDTYFVVAHFHYVLVGGMVFPLFAAFYYWAPAFSHRVLSDTLGKYAFWLMFIGFNVAFFPMHLAGLWGMPRRVYTYPAELGWGTLNMISTIGAFMLAAGVLVFLWDLVRNLRPTLTGGAGNVWKAGTLEWLPGDVYGVRSIPLISSRNPLWDQPALQENVGEGRYYLPNAPTGVRETIVTSAIEAAPQYVLRLPGPGWTPLLAAVFTAAFFMLLTVKLVMLAVVCGAVSIAMILAWMWHRDPEPLPPVDIGGGIKLPTYVSGPMSHSWLAMMVLLLVAGSLYLAYVFSYLYLWTVAPQYWPQPGERLLSPLIFLSGALLVLGSALMLAASYALSMPARRRARVAVLLLAAVAAIAASLTIEFVGQWQSGLRPSASGYAAMVYLAGFLQLELVVAVGIMALFVAVRVITNRVDAERRVTLDNTAILLHYTVAQGLVGLALVHGFPRLVS
ncbi:MAG TPA: cbb3-type cytochrome c oxidase subunit I [Vicinamibacterales bacterium]